MLHKQHIHSNTGQETEIHYDEVRRLRRATAILLTNYVEHGAYFFEFVKKGENTALTIFETEDLHLSEAERKSILVINSLSKQLTEPFYIALKKLCSQKYQKDDWSYDLIDVP